MIEIKRGDTFVFYTTLTDENEDPIILNPSTDMRCQVRRQNSNKLVDELTIETTNVDGRYKFESPDTSDYPIEVLVSDIRFDIADVVKTSDTFQINVVREVTVREVVV